MIVTVTTVLGVIVAAAIWRRAAPATPASAPPVASSGSTSGMAASSESPAIRCEFEGATAAELKAMESGAGPAGEAAARDRCIAHEAYKYDLEIDSTITGATMRGRSNTIGRIQLVWVYGSRPKEGHWEGVGILVSNTIALGAPTCPPGIPTVDGFGTYDFQVRWAQISLADQASIKVFIDAGPAVEAHDTLRLPACVGGGTSPTHFWENQFFLTHFAERDVHGLRVDKWTGMMPAGVSDGLLAMKVSPETCQGMCQGQTKFNLHVTRVSP